LNLFIIIITIGTFFIGYLTAPIIYKNNIKFLQAYPIWLTTKLKRLLNTKLKFHKLFAMIFSFNSLSLFLILISELIPFLPTILILWLGINLGISILHISGKKSYFLVLINPVALLEILATFITGYISIKFSILNFLRKLSKSNDNLFSLISNLTFRSTLKIFLHYTIPILFTAAVVETTVIILTVKRMK